MKTMDNYELLPGERFPAGRLAPERAEIEAILADYGVRDLSGIKLLDTTRDASDIRLNYIVDKKVVLRFANAPGMSEQRLEELNRLIGRYADMGLRCPKFLLHPDGKFLHPWSDMQYYLSEYIDLSVADEVEIEDESRLMEEVADSVAGFAEKYRNVDLSETMGMYSLFEQSPLDKEAGIDEKEDNFRELVKCLRDLSQDALAERLEKKNTSIREKLKAVYGKLPRCVFQGDENFTNVLVDAGQHFAGFIDFNLAGTEVIVNQLANLAGFDYDEENKAPEGASNRLAHGIAYYQAHAGRMLRIYHAVPLERQAMAWYAWIVMAAQWPTVCFFRDGLSREPLRDEILELLSLIADLPEDALTV